MHNIHGKLKLNFAILSLFFLAQDDIYNCTCSDYFEGARCEICKCSPGGECLKNENNYVGSCSCFSNYTGEFCQTKLSASSSQQAGLSSRRKYS